MKKALFISFLSIAFVLGCSSGDKNTSVDNGAVDPGIKLDIGHSDPGKDLKTDIQAKEDVKSTDIAPSELPKDVPGTDQIQPVAFKVKSTSPKEEETGVKTPFIVSVTFNRPVRSQSIISANFYVLGPDNKPISGTFNQPGRDTVTFTPAKAMNYLPASPYTVILSNNIMDENGYRLEAIKKFTFYTGVAGGTGKYKELAAKYSPIIRQAVDPSEPKADYLTRIDFDNDWDAHNNWISLQKAKAIPSDVYYDCVETPSHYFIYYVYYHGLYNSETKELKHGNDMEGAMVVVAKYPNEHPIAVETYFQAGQTTEEMLSFVTNESGIVSSGVNKNKVSVDQSFAQAALFPAGHFLAYITSNLGKAHESCLWILNDPSATYCKLSNQIKSGLKIIKYVYSDGTEFQIKADKNGFPTQIDEASYALRPVLEDLWTRRFKGGDKGLFDGSFQYWSAGGDPDNDDSRPGAGITLARRFPDSVNEGTSAIKGMPPWSWKWNHEFSVNPNLRTKNLPRGMILLDPAYYFVKRHNIKNAYNSQKKTGFSTDYCFNPYLGIDKRGTNTDCPK